MVLRTIKLNLEWDKKPILRFYWNCKYVEELRRLAVKEEGLWSKQIQDVSLSTKKNAENIGAFNEILNTNKDWKETKIYNILLQYEFNKARRPHQTSPCVVLKFNFTMHDRIQIEPVFVFVRHNLFGNLPESGPFS